jgi:hypothetical protein
MASFECIARALKLDTGELMTEEVSRLPFRNTCAKNGSAKMLEQLRNNPIHHLLLRQKCEAARLTLEWWSP